MATILCYGDSNTYGTPPMQHETDSARFDRPDRWPGVLADALGAEHHVIEEGLPGRTVCNDHHIKGPAWNGLRMLPAVLASHAPVDLLIVMLGTNDFQHRYAMPGQEVALGLMRLAEQVTLDARIGRQLFIVPPPVREVGLFAEVFSGAEARQASFEGHLRRLMGPLGIEVMTATPHASVDALDGVHLTAQDHHRLGGAIAGKTRDILSLKEGQTV